ncbi:hypothetical protein HZA55_07515 [Candidatus Poribacteria bacterium]|nr:hypothetical protein [Candidatus Poribacteria bacterium]
MIEVKFFLFVMGQIKISEEATLAELFNKQVTEKEQKILEIIKNEEYEEITIKKINNQEFILKGKNRKSGDFSKQDVLHAMDKNEYQSIYVTKKDGKIVSLIKEDTT